MELPIVRLAPHAILPSYAHEDDAGMDLYCAEHIEIGPHARVQISTGIALGVPKGYVGLIWDKSGVSHKRGLKTLGGVIDAGYTGEVLVGMYNTTPHVQIFEVGDKVAQIIIQKIEHPQVVEVERLEDTLRGRGGFGSTGK